MTRRALRPLSASWPSATGLVLVLALFAGSVVGTSLGWARAHDPSRRARPQTLRILATPDLVDMAAALADFTKTSGTAIHVDYVGADELVQKVARPDFPDTYDAVWMPENDLRPLPEAVESRLEAGTPVMSTPLVLGLRASTAAQLSADPSDLGWTRLAAAGKGNPFTFGMLDPATNDDAGAALLGIAADLAGAADPITSRDVYRIGPELRALRRRQTFSGTSYRDLTERFARSPGAAGVLSLESEILRTNASMPPADPDRLVVVAPGGQAVVVQYQLRQVLSPWRRSDSDAVRRLTDYLTSPPVQLRIAHSTHRRPAVQEALIGGEFVNLQPTAVPRVPGLLKTLSGIYLGTFHYPTRSVFVLDLSGSMRGPGITMLRKAFHSLGPASTSRIGRDAQILVIPFADRPRTTREVAVTAADPAAGLARLARTVDHLQPGGGTAIYAALERADDELARRTRVGQEQVTSIFLITDGANTSGPGLTHFRRHRATLEHTQCTRRSRDRCQIPVYPVLVGNADLTQMRALAHATGGRVHDARNVDLDRVLQELTTGR